ncbi:MAG: hypothetical protein KUG67_02620 [Proteobacteria bacterium]|nr:hypothetical protein [Pseudomonadota bacterium]
MGLEKFYLYFPVIPRVPRFLDRRHTKTAEDFFPRRFAVDVVVFALLEELQH